MKVLERYSRKPRAYADSYGEMLVELEENETVEDAIKEYGGTKDGGWHVNRFDKELNEYEIYGKVYKGKLVLFKTRDRYTG